MNLQMSQSGKEYDKGKNAKMTLLFVRHTVQRWQEDFLLFLEIISGKLAVMMSKWMGEFDIMRGKPNRQLDGQTNR